MAASMAGAVGTFSQILKSQCLNGVITKSLWAVPVRCKRYGPIYMEPTFRKEDLAKPLDENDERNFKPIKAALNEETCSYTYHPLLAKYTRAIMRKGNKDKAREVVDRTIERIKQFQLGKFYSETDPEKQNNIELNPETIFEQAVENCKPMLRLQKVRRGGVMYMVPIPISESYRLYKSMDWLIEATNDLPSYRRTWDRMANVIIQAYQNEGGAIRKKQDLNRKCEANRAYAHYRY